MTSARATAAIDLGTNSTRLLVCGVDGSTLARHSTVTGLGRGLNDGGSVLSADAIERTVNCLRAYRLLLEQHDVQLDQARVMAFATSAARDATNRNDFFDAAHAALGVRPVLLTGEEEGRLAFAGATADLEARQTEFGEDALDLVLDIGGGSTEFVVGVTGQQPIGAFSADAGCVRFTDKYLSEFDPPGPEALSGAVSVMRAHLEDVDRDLPAAKRATRLIGIAGSVTTTAAIEIGISTYARDRIHHFMLTRSAAEDVFRTLAMERGADRAANPGLPLDRVDTIVAGVLILVTVMRHFEFDECLVSDNDTLDGAIAQLRRTAT